jgi:hypothetical protein
MSFRSKSLDDEGYVTHQDSLELRSSDTPTSFAKGAKGYELGVNGGSYFESAACASPDEEPMREAESEPVTDLESKYLLEFDATLRPVRSLSLWQDELRGRVR